MHYHSNKLLVEEMTLIAGVDASEIGEQRYFRPGSTHIFDIYVDRYRVFYVGCPGEPQSTVPQITYTGLDSWEYKLHHIRE